MRSDKLHSLDLLLVLSTFAVAALGVIMVFSATKTSRAATLSFSDPAVRQAVFAVIGIALMFIVSRIDYRFLDSFIAPFYVGVLLLLGLVALLGVVSFGSARWLNLGFMPVQPSEFAKLALILALAKLYSAHEKELNKVKWFVAAVFIALIPAAVVYEQPDLGTAIMLTVIFVGLTLGAKVAWKILLGAVALAVPAMIAFWMWIMHDYQRDRFLIFLHPETDLLGQGYNMIQARTAIGSGGWLGQGYMAGSQSTLDFLKVQYSDFIWSVVAEEFGFIGCLALLALLFFLVWRILSVASRARDTFGSLIAVGVATWIGMQVFINVGMNIGLMPVTGIPLPFISYGGSSLMSILLGLGLVQSVALRSTSIIFGGNQWRAGWARAGRTTLRPR